MGEDKPMHMLMAPGLKNQRGERVKTLPRKIINRQLWDSHLASWNRYLKRNKDFGLTKLDDLHEHLPNMVSRGRLTAARKGLAGVIRHDSQETRQSKYDSPQSVGRKGFPGAGGGLPKHTSEFSSIPGLAQAQPKRILNRRAAPVRLHLSKNGTMAGQDLGQTKDSPLSRRTMRGAAHTVASARLSEFRGDRKARWLIQPPGVGWYSEFNA